MALYTKHCQQCSETFVARRKDAKYCCSTCRVKASRARRNGMAVNNDMLKLTELRTIIAQQAEMIELLKQALVQSGGVVSAIGFAAQPGNTNASTLPGAIGKPLTMPRYEDDNPAAMVSIKKASGGGNSGDNFLNSLMALNG